MWKWISVIFCIIIYIQCVKFGVDNSYTCHCINDEQCDKETGECGGGCAAGWSGPTCQKPSWSLSSLNGFSIHVNRENEEPELCYKDDIIRYTTPAVNNIECSQVITGRYVNISNFHTSRNARFLDLCEVEIYECDNGTYGQDCQYNCSARFCQSSDLCSNLDGACVCLDTYQGIDCTVEKGAVSSGKGVPENPEDSVTIIIAAVVSVCVLLIIIVVCVVLIIRRRRAPPPVDDETSDKSVTRNMAVVKQQAQGPIYENSDVIREGSVARVTVEPERNVYQNEQPEAEAELENEAEPSTETEEDDISPYILPDKSDYNLAELEEFVKKTKPNDGFDPFYKGLPNTFTSSYDISQLPENRKKNRFKGYYPYDATRVVLNKVDDDPRSDYINANFLNGYDGKTFIAAQGATRVNLNDFVRMIWDMKCDKVVMVTREFEDRKRKCERYWPSQVGSSETFGVIKLTLIEEIYRENYTKRDIIMER
ncbi:hypothetical protein LOTGIDRAFT_175985, partial [Lottia gigantea]